MPPLPRQLVRHLLAAFCREVGPLHRDHAAAHRRLVVEKALEHAICIGVDGEGCPPAPNCPATPGVVSRRLAEPPRLPCLACAPRRRRNRGGHRQ
eukprot:6799278-Pyramimonas_sp.AAC.1